MASQSAKKQKPNRLSIFALVVALMIFVPLLAFTGTLLINRYIFPPSGEFREVLNVENMSRRQLFDDSVSCFRWHLLHYRLVDDRSLQVQSSVLRENIRTCWDELDRAQQSAKRPSGDWVKTYRFWYGRQYRRAGDRGCAGDMLITLQLSLCQIRHSR